MPLSHYVSEAPNEVWERSLPAERADWNRLGWQQVPAERVRSEWTRHLGSLGLSMDFADREVLEVGCGPTGPIYFIDAQRRVGADPLAEFYEQWNGFYGDPVELVTSPGESLPLPDASFDVVLCINCIDHGRDAGAIMDEIARVTRPGGLLVFNVSIDSPLRRLHKLVKPRCRELHPLAIEYDWLRAKIEEGFTITRQRRDPEAFRPTKANMRYEAFWDGVMYRLTRSRTWMNHIWLTAERH